MMNMARELIENFHRIYSMLEDAQSKETYINRLNYLVTGNKQYIDCIVEKYLPSLPVRAEGTMERLVKAIPESAQVILYGAGSDAEQCLPYFQKCSGFVGMCDQELEKQKYGFHGYKVISPSELLEQYRDAFIVISTSAFAREIEGFLIEHGIPRKQIIRVDSYISTELPETYFGMDFLHFSDHEIFVDGGCYNLESTRIFMRHCRKVDKVFAFEPDPANFAQCERARLKNSLDRVELIPCGTWSDDATVSFLAASNPGSHIVDSGGTTVRLTSIDKVVGDAPVTFIKLDVEGAELESLKGAQETIRRNRPQLAVCIYHKPEDMVEIPLYIKSLVPDYRLYVRHIGNAQWDTVLYAV